MFENCHVILFDIFVNCAQYFTRNCRITQDDQSFKIEKPLKKLQFNFGEVIFLVPFQFRKNVSVQENSSQFHFCNLRCSFFSGY